MKGIKFIGTLVLLAVANMASAQVYTWKDANGRTHFSDQPPPEVNAKNLKSRSSATPTSETTETSAPASSDKSTPKTWQEKETEARQKKAEQAQAEEKKKQEQARLAAKDRHCEDLRRNLAMLERGGRIGRPNQKGEMEYFTDDQLAKETEQARANLAKDCK